MRPVLHSILILLAVLPAIAREDAPPFYEDKQKLLQVYDDTGKLYPVTAENLWKVRREHILESMQLVMGPLPIAGRKPPMEIRVEGYKAFEAYVQQRIAIRVEKDEWLPAYLLVPKRLRAKAPGVLCLHPTSPFGKGMVVGDGDKPNRNYAQELAKRGFVALAPDYPGFGEYKDCDAYALGYKSATMKGIWNHMRCVDALQSLPEVDPDNIGAIGHSLGGHNALFLGTFDTRVKAMVSSCGFNRFQDYYEGDLTGWSHKGYMPLIEKKFGKDPARMPFDFTEILGALAPRAVFVSAPVHDANFAVGGVVACVEAAVPVYNLYGAQEQLQVAYPDCDHDFPPEARELAYSFLETHLKKP